MESPRNTFNVVKYLHYCRLIFYFSFASSLEVVRTLTVLLLIAQAQRVIAHACMHCFCVSMLGDQSDLRSDKQTEMPKLPTCARRTPTLTPPPSPKSGQNRLKRCLASYFPKTCHFQSLHISLFPPVHSSISICLGLLCIGLIPFPFLSVLCLVCLLFCLLCLLFLFAVSPVASLLATINIFLC